MRRFGVVTIYENRQFQTFLTKINRIEQASLYFFNAFQLRDGFAKLFRQTAIERLVAGPSNDQIDVAAFRTTS